MNIVIVGAGRFGKVVAESFRQAGHEVLGWLDDNRDLHGATYWGAPVCGGIEELRRWRPADIGVHVAIGFTQVRLSLAARVVEMGYSLVNSIHPSAIVMPSVRMGRGVCICAGSILQSNVLIGDHVIVNTACSIDHDSILEEGAWIAPGVRTGGGVHVGRAAYISIGAVLAAGVNIGEGSVIGAGAIIAAHVPRDVLAIGAQPRFLKIDETFDWKRLIQGVPPAAS